MKGNGVNVLEVEAAIESGEEEALPAGGVVRPRRTRLSLDEKPGKNKTPRRKEPLEETQAPAVVLPAVSAEKPPENTSEVKDMETEKKPPVSATTATTQTRPEFAPCPLCGYGKSTQKHFLVCKGCNDKYISYAEKVADEIAVGKHPVILSKIEWVLSQLDLERFEKELEDARQKRSRLEDSIAQMIRAKAGDQGLPREVFLRLKAKCREEIIREDQFLVRRLFARLEAARKLKPELEQMRAEKTAPTATPSPVTAPISKAVPVT